MEQIEIKRTNHIIGRRMFDGLGEGDNDEWPWFIFFLTGEKSRKIEPEIKIKDYSEIPPFHPCILEIRFVTKSCTCPEK